MRTFVITADPAAPPISGAELRNWQNAVALAEFGPVVLISLWSMRQPAPSPDPRVELTALSKFGEKRSPALARRTTWIDIRISRNALDRLLQLVERAKPDVVIVEGIPLFPFLEYLRPLVKTLILDMHNIESELAASLPRRLSFRNIFGSDAARLRQRERAAARIVDGIWVCSDRERAQLRSLLEGSATIDIVPNGIPRADRVPKTLPARPAAKRAGPVMLFVGHLGYPPNDDAVRNLVNSILPLVLRNNPEARLLIAGRSPHSDLRSLADKPHVRLVENPGDDLAPLYAEADVAVIPLARGGGTRIKILEAMAYGVPVVATHKAAEGLEFKENADILLAHSNAGLVDHIRALWADPVRYEKQREQAFHAVTRRFGTEMISRSVRDALSRAGSLQT